MGRLARYLCAEAVAPLGGLQHALHECGLRLASGRAFLRIDATLDWRLRYYCYAFACLTLLLRPAHGRKRQFAKYSPSLCQCEVN